MILLRNFDDVSMYFNLELKINIQNSSISSVNGIYKLIDNELSALLVLDYKLYFVLEDEIKLIDDTFSVNVENSDYDNNKIVKFFSNEILVFQFSYAPPNEFLNTSPFEYIEEEDFNWGMFIENIINNKHRKLTFIRNLMKSPVGRDL